ncbi:YppG family protein [Neobacillus sp. PS3-34]|uniref:YppG family protein n=1 Tax=Neobacillus sp. PS3-34 TaxID=3070678 RepID=UPI0027DFBD05|nr:YppG family protein [Neobacillus sp. PS3-34]WML47728.1 YppG family protein [Neobacillus sp. PS3-34]
MFAKKKKNPDFRNGFPGQMLHGDPYNQFHVPWNSARNYPYPSGQSGYPIFQQQAVYNNPYQHGFPQGPQSYQQHGPGPESYPYSPYHGPQNDAQFIFQNPLQPQEEMYGNPYLQQNSYQQPNPYMNANPYPKGNVLPKQPGGMQSFMNSFKSQDGSVDYNKMMNTAGQMMNAVNQVSSLVKGFGGFFKV